MRGETDRAKIDAFMTALAQRVNGPDRIYFTGGGTAVLHGWRETTIDLDLKAEPEPSGFFEAIAALKDEIDLNIKLASPDDFLPPLPGWRKRSIFIAHRGDLDFYHYDPCAQALSKIERGHAQDVVDVQALLNRKLVLAGRLRELFGPSSPI